MKLKDIKVWLNSLIDEETKEVVFCHQEIKIDNGNEQSN